MLENQIFGDFFREKTNILEICSTVIFNLVAIKATR